MGLQGGAHGAGGGKGADPRGGGRVRPPRGHVAGIDEDVAGADELSFDHGNGERSLGCHGGAVTKGVGAGRHGASPAGARLETGQKKKKPNEKGGTKNRKCRSKMTTAGTPHEKEEGSGSAIKVTTVG